MSRTIVTLGLLVVVLFLAAGRRQTFAQSPVPHDLEGRLFDEYGNIRSGDHCARLDNFAIQLQNTPEDYGYVVVYAPESASKRIFDNITGYLVKTRGLPRDRIKTYHAGYNDPFTEPRVQLWIVPEGAEAPKPKKRKVNLAGFKGMLAEYQRGDHIELVGPEIDPAEDLGVGPPVGNVTFAAFDDVLKAQKHSVAHVVAFNGVDALPGTWRRVAESTVEHLKRSGFEAGRFKIAYGGQSKVTKVQLWILPPGETPPVKDPGSEPAPAKAIQVGEVDHGMLGYAQNELAVFNRLLMVLRENPDLRACLIVRMKVPVPEDQDAGPEVDPTPNEPELADLPKLVERWKSDLSAKHKIRPDRVVVLFANAQEYHMPFIEVWVVPPGQQLPDLDQ